MGIGEDLGCFPVVALNEEFPAVPELRFVVVVSNGETPFEVFEDHLRRAVHAHQEPPIFKMSRLARGIVAQGGFKYPLRARQIVGLD